MATTSGASHFLNSRACQRGFEYDGHSRRAGAAASDKDLKWRRIRRRMAKWLRREVDNGDGS